MPIAASPRDLNTLLASAQLPALPQSAVRLLQLSQNPNNGPPEFAVPIDADPGLTGQVLKFVNSSYFGFSKKITSVKLAITLVGVRTIKNFTLWSAVFSVMPNPKCGTLDLKSLWQDSLRRAIFARRFGKLLGVADAEELFATALLQDMAIPLLAKEMPQDYALLLAERGMSPRRLSELEQQQFGWTHAGAAGFLARKWSLPDSFAQLLESHIHLPKLLAEPKHDHRALAVALSSHLPAVCDERWRDASMFREAFAQLAGSGQPIEKLLDEVDFDFAEFAPLLKLATPSQTLSQRWAELVT